MSKRQELIDAWRRGDKAWRSTTYPYDIRVVVYPGVNCVVWQHPWSLCRKGVMSWPDFLRWARGAVLAAAAIGGEGEGKRP